MKIEDGVLKVEAKVMEDILHNGLRVLAPVSGYVVDTFITLEEVINENPTGRYFGATITHVPATYVIQITVSRFMTLINEMGMKEKFPMTGEFEAEKVSIPEGPWNASNIVVSGEKPVWMYRGEKWVQEVSLQALFFEEENRKNFEFMKPSPPTIIHLAVNGQGGNRLFKYALLKEVQ
jgi:hypothetical protein